MRRSKTSLLKLSNSVGWENQHLTPNPNKDLPQSPFASTQLEPILKSGRALSRKHPDCRVKLPFVHILTVPLVLSRVRCTRVGRAPSFAGFLAARVFIFLCPILLSVGLTTGAWWVSLVNPFLNSNDLFPNGSTATLLARDASSLGGL